MAGKNFVPRGSVGQASYDWRAHTTATLLHARALGPPNRVHVHVCCWAMYVALARVRAGLLYCKNAKWAEPQMPDSSCIRYHPDIEELCTVSITNADVTATAMIERCFLLVVTPSSYPKMWILLSQRQRKQRDAFLLELSASVMRFFCPAAPLQRSITYGDVCSSLMLIRFMCCAWIDACRLLQQSRVS